MEQMQFYHHQFLILSSKWVRHINLHHPLQSDWKTGARQSVLKSNYMWWVDWKKANELLTYSLIVVNVQFVIMLIKLQKVLSRTKVILLQDYHSPTGMKCTKTMEWVSYIFIALEINKHTAYKCTYTIQKCIYTVHAVHTIFTRMHDDSNMTPNKQNTSVKGKCINTNIRWLPSPPKKKSATKNILLLIAYIYIQSMSDSTYLYQSLSLSPSSQSVSLSSSH